MVGKQSFATGYLGLLILLISELANFGNVLQQIKRICLLLGFVFRFLGCLGFKGHPDRIPLVPRGRPWPPARWPPPPPLTTHMPSNLPLVCAGMSTSTALHILLPIAVHCTQRGSASVTSAKCAKLVIKSQKLSIFQILAF